MAQSGTGKRGRPKTEIDPVQLERLAQIHCTIDEAAAVLGCSKSTIIRYLKEPGNQERWDAGREKGRASLRRLQWQHANGTGASAVTMTVHLSKHWLGETEKVLQEVTGKDGTPFSLNVIIDGSSAPPKAG
jgi:hypothetical protein